MSSWTHCDRQTLYHEALQWPRTSAGTPYGVSQYDLNNAINGRYGLSNSKQSLSDAARILIAHNDTTRRPPPADSKDGLEARAIGRLKGLLGCKKGQESIRPDVVYKTYRDLDAVFFRRKLFEVVCVKWKSGNEESKDVLGRTVWKRPNPPYIELFAGQMFGVKTDRGIEEGAGVKDWRAEILKTLLHEMCHAYIYVVSKDRKEGHGKRFQDIYRSVDERGNALGFWGKGRVTGREEEFSMRWKFG